jgi:hypothetical protein
VHRLRRDRLADENLQAARRPVERIAFGHVLTVTRPGRLSGLSVTPTLNIAALRRPPAA